jgi:hypothetical protein
MPTAVPVEHRAVALDVRPGPDVLPRVLGLLLRRRCTVTRVDFIAADRHRPGRLEIAYDAPAGHADRAAEWLDALVDVLGVTVTGRSG